MCGENWIFGTPKIDSFDLLTLGWMTNGSIYVYECGSSVKSANDQCFESHLRPAGRLYRSLARQQRVKSRGRRANECARVLAGSCFVRGRSRLDRRL